MNIREEIDRVTALHLGALAPGVREAIERGECGDLSAAEVAFIPEAKARPWKPKGLPVAEIDCELMIDGSAIAVTLAVWGTFHKAHKGGHEKGERPYEPDDPASFEVDTIMIGDTDVTAELGQAGEDAISQYVMENCE